MKKEDQEGQAGKLKKQAEICFKCNKVDILYLTSDGSAFQFESDALNHARTLEDKEVVTFKREDI